MADDLKARIAAIPYWYHRIELPGSVETPGWAPLLPESYRLPDNLTGARVLDVGAWDGYWTFAALKRGAREVVAIDDFSDSLGEASGVTRNKKWETFDLCRDAFGYGDDRCKRLEMSVYDVSPSTLGMFDVVLFFGTLYHLRHPLLALDRLAAVCTQALMVETAILDDYSPYRGGLGRGYPADDEVVMEFYPDNQYGKNSTNWWVPSLTCLGEMVRSTGFEKVVTWKFLDGPAQPSECRGFACGVRGQDKRKAD